MKIQCNACEMAEASVLCCSDDAALCWACDEKIHAANKLASKHQRVPLSNSSSQMPKCDICQEATGYFFCLEDRALLCRKCDVAIHTANAYVSAHRRFLLTGVKVGLEPTDPVVSSSPKEKKNSVEKATEIPCKAFPGSGNSSKSFSGSGNLISLSSENKDVSSQAVGDGVLPLNKVSFSGGSIPGITPDWPLEDFLGLTDFNQNYGFMEQGSSKADSVKHGHGDSGWSPIYRAAAAEDLDIDEYLSLVPEIPWTVPQIPSPPTASGLSWPRSVQNDLLADSSVFVPDICYLQNVNQYQSHPASSKRRRQS